MDYLKHGFVSHPDDDNVAGHNVRRAQLGAHNVENNGSDSISTFTKTACVEFLKLFHVEKSIKKRVNAGRDGIQVALQNCATKFKLFMRHEQQCYVQHTVFQEADKETQVVDLKEYQIVRVDYKRKYYPRKFDHKSSDCYGRKGMSLLGSVVIYRFKEDGDGFGRSASTMGSTIYTEKNLCFDHVFKNN